MAEEKAEQCDKTSSCPSDKELKGVKAKRQLGCGRFNIQKSGRTTF